MSNVVEKYSRAIGSSHLEVTEFAGDVDKLIAAGWVRENLATALYRVRHDFDGADKAALRRGGWSTSEQLRFLARMPSLKTAKAALDNFVLARARHEEFDGTLDKCLWISGRILENFLHSTCTECFGRREKEVPGSARLSGVQCAKCEGTGLRSLKFTGNTPFSEIVFTRGLQAEIDSKLDNVNLLMARFLREPR